MEKDTPINYSIIKRVDTSRAYNNVVKQTIELEDGWKFSNGDSVAVFESWDDVKEALKKAKKGKKWLLV